MIEAAQLTKTLLDELGLVCFLKTTGGKGLHIVTPIQRTQGWEEAKPFAKMVADHLVTAIPQRFTSNMAKRVRKGKIFIDYLRNARGATAIAAYSTRAKPGAPVSVPIAWDELSKDLFGPLHRHERAGTAQASPARSLGSLRPVRPPSDCGDGTAAKVPLNDTAQISDSYPKCLQ